MAKKNKIKQICLIVVLAVLIAGGIAGLLNIDKFFVAKECNQLADLNVIYNNIYIRGNAVGGLTKEQAIEKMNSIINNDYTGDKKISFMLSEATFEKSFTYPELGMGFDVEKAVNEAYAIGRNEDGSTNYAEVSELDMGGKYIDAEIAYSTDKVRECLSTIEDEVNAMLEPYGKVMDLERTAEAAEQLLRVNQYDSLVIIATK